MLKFSKKTAVVCGASGFIGGHLVELLKSRNYWVRGVDIVEPQYRKLDVDDFLKLDLRLEGDCRKALTLSNRNSAHVDEVYQLAADMGGMGYIESAECEILRNNTLISLQMIEAARALSVGRYFYSSSVCVYRDMAQGEPQLTEEQAIPANPDNEYGWEKLYAERMAMAYARRHKMCVRIARFQNCFGPFGAWTGGREKAPSAVCRKIAEVDDGSEIEIWGDGTAVRCYIYVSDLVEAVYTLMHSSLIGPTNIGTEEYVSVNELIDAVRLVSGKQFGIRFVPGPVGVASRNFSNEKIYSTGWRPKVSLSKGIKLTYPWILEQLKLSLSDSKIPTLSEEPTRLFATQ